MFYKTECPILDNCKNPLFGLSHLLSDTAGGSGGVVRDEPVVDVEGDEEGGEAGDGDDVQNSWVVDQEEQPVLIFNIEPWRTQSFTISKTFKIREMVWVEPV